jgi:hypothetical protein
MKSCTTTFRAAIEGNSISNAMKPSPLVAPNDKTDVEKKDRFTVPFARCKQRSAIASNGWRQYILMVCCRIFPMAG